jgi:hypothetical protein
VNRRLLIAGAAVVAVSSSPSFLQRRSAEAEAEVLGTSPARHRIGVLTTWRRRSGADPVEARTAASRGNRGPAPADRGSRLLATRALEPRVFTRLGARHELAATREIPAPRETIFGFLASLENHAALGRGSVELLSLECRAGGTSEAVVRLRGPLAIRRTASTAITGTRAPESISGRARIGPRTRAFVSWRIESTPHGSTVSVGATVETAGLRDRLLLAFGGRWWLGRRFASALSCLSQRIAPTPAFVSGGDSALSAVPSHACA